MRDEGDLSLHGSTEARKETEGYMYRMRDMCTHLGSMQVEWRIRDVERWQSREEEKGTI